jgi:hypothetical protein
MKRTSRKTAAIVDIQRVIDIIRPVVSGFPMTAFLTKCIDGLYASLSNELPAK